MLRPYIGGPKHPVPSPSGHDRTDAVREGLGRARRPAVARRPGAPVRGPAPGARGDVAAGVRGVAAGGAPGASAGADGGDGGPNVPTGDRAGPIADPIAARQLEALAVNARDFGVELFDLRSPQQGIVHVIGPELGFTQPGMVIVCGDSHTATHGAFGALALGIGTSEVEHVLATQCLVWSKPGTMEARVTGTLAPGVTAKDLILALIGRIGTAGATGHVIEYTGDAIRALSMEERMTVCNMSIEAGARAGMIAPDEKTVAYLAGRPRAPSGAAWDRAVATWRELRTDPGATYDKRVELDASEVAPQVTWGTRDRK